MRPPLLLAVAVALLAAAPATAAQPLAPVDLSAPAGTGSASCAPFDLHPGSAGVDVAANAAGDTIVTWTRNDGAGGQIVQASVRPAGGTFGLPETIGPTLACYTLGVAGPTPEAALDAQGNAVVVFSATAPSGRTVTRAALRPAGGAFGVPADLSNEAQSAQGDARLAMNEAGAAVVAWSRSNGSRTVVQASTRPPGGAFAPPLDLSNALQNARSPHVAIDAAGAVAVAWTRDSGGATPRDIVQATLRPAGATAAFTTVQDLSAGGQNAFSPRIALDAAGRATVAWHRTTGSVLVAQARSLTDEGAIATGVDDISEPGESAAAIELAVDAAGAAVALYVACPASGSCIVKAADRPANGGFGTGEAISPPVANDARVRLAVDATGAASALFGPFTAPEPVRLARRPPGGEFGAVQTISAPGLGAFAPALAADGEGNVLLGWTSGTASTATLRVQASVFDAAPPTLEALDVPASAVAGQSVRMTASARDRWSGATVAWDFGDGTGATGAEVVHAFGPGSHTVGVSATDGAGNAASATRTVQVAAPPPPAGPLPVIASPVRTRWALKGKRLLLLALRVAQPPKRAVASLRCRGAECPFARKTVRASGRALDVLKALSVARALRRPERRFQAGQRLELRISARGFVGKVVRFELRAGRVPQGRVRCLAPDARAPTACPQ